MSGYQEQCKRQYLIAPSSYMCEEQEQVSQARPQVYDRGNTWQSSWDALFMVQYSFTN